jgi:hypothetical protein
MMPLTPAEVEVPSAYQSGGSVDAMMLPPTKVCQAQAQEKLL